MNIRFLETFVWAARLGSFSLAAERVSTTLAAASARIQAVEQELGVTLFERKGRHIRLTSKGRDALPMAERLVRLAGDFKSAIRATDSMAGRVKLGVIDTAAAALLAPLLREAERRLPGVEIDLHTDTSRRIIDRLTAGDIDLAISLVGVSAPDAINLRLLQMSCQWIAAPSLLPKARKMGLEDLAHFPVLSFAQGSQPDAEVRALFAPYGGPRRLYCGTSLATVLSLARQGLGIAICPSVLVSDDLAAGTLVRLPVRSSISPLHFQVSYLNSPHDQLLSRLAEIACDVAAEYCRGHPSKLVWI